MGTRSDIIVQLAPDLWARIYCHWDGYPAHNGRLLRDHYSTGANAAALIALGSLSSLAPFTSKPDGHTFASPVKGYCVAYGRDRGETDTQAFEGPTLAAVWPTDCGTDYAYVKPLGLPWRYCASPGADKPKRTRLLTAKACAED